MKKEEALTPENFNDLKNTCNQIIEYINDNNGTAQIRHEDFMSLCKEIQFFVNNPVAKYTCIVSK